MPQLLIFNVANMSFNAIRQNKILAKISEFTIFPASEMHQALYILCNAFLQDPHFIQLFFWLSL